MLVKLIVVCVVFGFLFVVGAILKFCFENIYDYFIDNLKHIN